MDVLSSRTEFMRLAITLLLTVLLAISLAEAGAQDSPTAAKPSSRAVIAGIVTKDPGSEPVKKVLIELIAEDQTQGGDYTAVSGPDGGFRIENILPGRYHLFAEHTGLLEADRQQGRVDGRVLTLTAGQEMKDLQIRLLAAAVIEGRVTDEDGDPMPNAEVTVMRKSFASGHHHWEQAGAERTNDLGDYRIANLAAGNVYISVSPPPDFRSLIEASGAGANASSTDAHNPNNPQKPATSYQTIYYPGTPDRSQAAAVQLHPGDDFPASFSLTPSPSLSIRGSVTNLPPQTSAAIMLQSHDFSLVLNGAEMHKDGSFVIHDVSPGTYTIVANVEGLPVSMTARQSVQVASSDVDGIRLSPQPGATVRGRLRFENVGGGGGGGKIDPEQMFVSLKPVDGDEDTLAFSLGEPLNLAHVNSDGSFEWKDIPPGDYYVQLGSNGAGNDNQNNGWFLKSAAAGGRDVDAGINVSGGAVTLDLVASNNGGAVDGAVTDSKGDPVQNAVVVAVPEAGLRSRSDRYRTTVSDQTGHFAIRGIRPGSYTVFAWESVDGDAYYDPEFLKNYEEQGTALQISEGARKSLQIQAIPSPNPSDSQ